MPTDGEHTLTVRAVDAAGNADETPESRTWTADTTAPTTEVMSNRSGATSETDVEIFFNASDSQGYECKFNDEDWDDCTSPFSRSGLADDDYTFQVRATDAVGNVEDPPAKAEWTVDTVDPETTIDSGPVEDSTVASDEVTFTFSSDPGADFECTLDGGSPVDCDSGTFTEDDLGEGEHTFTVAAIDAAGNADASPAERTWNVDTTAPSTAIDTDVPAFLDSRDATIAFSSGRQHRDVRVPGGRRDRHLDDLHLAARARHGERRRCPLVPRPCQGRASATSTPARRRRPGRSTPPRRPRRSTTSRPTRRTTTPDVRLLVERGDGRHVRLQARHGRVRGLRHRHARATPISPTVTTRSR